MKAFQNVSISIVILFLFSILTVNSVFADTPPMERDYTISVGEGELIFVMLSRTHGSQTPEIRALYPKSGLYNVTGKVPRALWTVDWYAFKVDLSADGKHLIRWGPWASSAPQIAVEFYADGKLTKSYKIEDLVRRPESLPHSVSHFTWKRDVEFNQAKNELYIETLNNEKYLFDVSTGLCFKVLWPTSLGVSKIVFNF